MDVFNALKPMSPQYIFPFRTNEPLVGFFNFFASIDRIPDTKLTDHLGR